jgi:electron transfer flavoprotein beta subunit
MSHVDPDGICVLVSAGIHPASGWSRPSHNDLHAVRIGRAATGLVSSLFTHGDVSENVLRGFLRTGADTLTQLEGGEALETLAHTLAQLPASRRRAVLCGARSETGLGRGMLPYKLAAALGLELVANVEQVRYEDGMLVVTTQTTLGTHVVESTQPLVLVAAVPRIAVPYGSYQAQLRGRIVREPSFLPAGNDAGAATNFDGYVPLAERNLPTSIDYPAGRTAGERLAAIRNEAQGHGTKLVDPGAAEAVRVILDFLSSRGAL